MTGAIAKHSKDAAKRSEQAISILRAMQRRMPWEAAQKALHAEDIPRGRGWDLTIKKLEDHDWSEDNLITLDIIYKNSLLYGEKSISFFKLTGTQIKKLRDEATTIQVPNSALATRYPLPLSDSQLATAKPTKQKLIYKEVSSHGITLIYSCIYIVDTRHNIPLNNIPQQATKIFNGYREVIGVREEKLQSFDVLWIPSRGNIVSTRVDHPRIVPQETILQMQTNFHDILDNDLNGSLQSNVVNLFPLIKKLYKDATQGNVVELAFGTTTASLKHERMRRAGTCLRTEIYHKAGLDALKGEIEPYRISVEWRHDLGDDITSSPELSLIGRSQMTLSDAPFLGQAILRNCTGESDFDQVMDNILPIL